MPAIIPIPAFTDNCIRIPRAREPALLDAAEGRAGRHRVDAADAIAALRGGKNNA